MKINNLKAGFLYATLVTASTLTAMQNTPVDYIFNKIVQDITGGHIHDFNAFPDTLYGLELSHDINSLAPDEKNILLHMVYDIQADYQIKRPYIKLLVLNGAYVDYNLSHEHIETLLSDAVWHGDLEMVNFLLNEGADATGKNYSNGGPLLQFVYIYPLAKLLVEHGALTPYVNNKSLQNELFTHLFLAAAANWRLIPLYKQILEKKYHNTVSFKKPIDKYGNTLLHVLCQGAATESDLDPVDFSEKLGILEADGVDLQAKNRFGQRPIDIIHIAKQSAYAQFNTETIELAQARLTQREQSVPTHSPTISCAAQPLEQEIFNTIERDILDKHIRSFEFFSQSPLGTTLKEKIDQLDQQQKNQLLKKIYNIPVKTYHNNRLKRVYYKFLITCGADVNYNIGDTSEKHTVLEEAVKAGDTLLVRFLLHNGARATDTNYPNRSGLLEYAYSPPGAAALIEHGALEPYATNRDLQYKLLKKLFINNSRFNKKLIDLYKKELQNRYHATLYFTPQDEEADISLLIYLCMNARNYDTKAFYENLLILDQEHVLDVQEKDFVGKGPIDYIKDALKKHPRNETLLFAKKTLETLETDPDALKTCTPGA